MSTGFMGVSLYLRHRGGIHALAADIQVGLAAVDRDGGDDAGHAGRVAVAGGRHGLADQGGALS